MADKKVIAVTTVHRTLEAGVAADKSKGTAAKPPKVQVIQAGTIFLASTDERKGMDQSEYDELKAMGAIRDPEKDEKVSVSVENIVADDSGGVRKTTKTTTTASGAGTTGKGSTAGKTGTKSGEGTQSGDATGAKAGEGAGSGDSNDLV